MSTSESDHSRAAYASAGMLPRPWITRTKLEVKLILYDGEVLPRSLALA